MTNRVANLEKPALPNPPAIGNIVAHVPAKALHVHQMFRAQDGVLTPGRRILMSEGMRGSPFFQCTDIDIANGDDVQACFQRDTERIVAKADHARLTPGCLLVMEARCLPSGPTCSVSSTPISYAGDSGRIRLRATWDDGTTTEVVTTDLQFDAPQTEFGHGVDLHGSGFSQLEEKRVFNFPPTMFFNYDDLVSWTQGGISVDLELVYMGGIRPVDVVVYEAPYKYARADGIPAGPAHIYQTNENLIGSYPLEYPVEGASSGDRRFGASYALDVSAEQQVQLGPTILCTSAYSGAREPESLGVSPYLVTSTSWAPLDYTAPLGGGDEAPSYDFSVGSFGREFKTSGSAATGNTGVVRVLVSVEWKVTGGEARMRFKTSDWSYIEVSTTSTGYFETEATGFLECGQTVLDKKQLEILAEVDSSETASVRYVKVEYLPE